MEKLVIIFSVLVPVAGLFLVLRADNRRMMEDLRVSLEAEIAENRRATEDVRKTTEDLRKTTEDLRVGLATVQTVLQMQGYYRSSEGKGREGGEGRSGGGDSV